MCRNRLRLEKAEGGRDEALKTADTLTLEKEAQVDSHRRLLKETQDRELALIEKLKHATRYRNNISQYIHTSACLSFSIRASSRSWVSLRSRRWLSSCASFSNVKVSAVFRASSRPPSAFSSRVELVTLYLDNIYIYWCGVSIVCRNRLRLEKAEGGRDEALKTAVTLASEKEAQLDSHRRLLKETQDRELALIEKLKHAEVCM